MRESTRKYEKVQKIAQETAPETEPETMLMTMIKTVLENISDCAENNAEGSDAYPKKAMQNLQKGGGCLYTFKGLYVQSTVI